MRRIIGITGPPGAGKSTIAEALVAELGDRAILVPMDGFHLPNAQLRELGLRGRKGAPDTFDVVGYVALLTRLRVPADEVRYVDLDDAVRLERLIARHEAFGMSREAATAWATGPDAANATVIAATRARADVFVRNR